VNGPVRVEETAVPGAYVIVPEQIRDDRGNFYECLRTDELERVLGYPFVPFQINYSVSRRGTLRGIHSVSTPPGQAKYVTCVRGALRDIVVDLRVGSPAFGRHAVVELDAESGRSVFVPEGVGHGFLALADDTCISYAVSSTYAPGTQVHVHPLDPELALPWGFSAPPVLSAKDAGAPSLAETEAAGLLTHWHLDERGRTGAGA
jgi:NDP-hexose 3,5-(Or5-) epimerase